MKRISSRDRINLDIILKRVDKVLAGERLSVMDDDVVLSKNAARFYKRLTSSSSKCSVLPDGKRVISEKDLEELHNKILRYWRQIELNEGQCSKTHKENVRLSNENVSLNTNVANLTKELKFSELKSCNMTTEIKHLNEQCQKFRRGLDETRVEVLKARENQDKLEAESQRLKEELEKAKNALREKDMQIKMLEGQLMKKMNCSTEQHEQQLIGDRVKKGSTVDAKAKMTKPEQPFDISSWFSAGENNLLLQSLASDNCLRDNDASSGQPWVMWSPKNLNSTINFTYYPKKV